MRNARTEGDECGLCVYVSGSVDRGHGDVTPSDGIALASLAVTALATYLTYRTGREASKDAHELAQAGWAAQAAAARGARLHEARKQTYVELLEFAYALLDIVNGTEALVERADGGKLADWPSGDDQRRQNVQVAAFGSDAMRDKVGELSAAVRTFRTAVNELRRQPALGRPMRTGDAREKTEQARSRVHTAVAQIGDQANEELSE